jgi:hypothetical protein
MNEPSWAMKEIGVNNVVRLELIRRSARAISDILRSHDLTLFSSSDMRLGFLALLVLLLAVLVGARTEDGGDGEDGGDIELANNLAYSSPFSSYPGLAVCYRSVSLRRRRRKRQHGSDIGVDWRGRVEFPLGVASGDPYVRSSRFESPEQSLVDRSR